MATLYEILEVGETATSEEIKDAYRRQAMKWHPDRNPTRTIEAEQRFKQIANAYKVLFDPHQRAEYDIWLVSQRSSTAGQQQRASSSGPSMSGDDAAKMFFEQMLDMAFEIARRGYDEQAIYKALLGLDCPEAIAKTVAKHATTNSKKQRTAAEQESPKPPPTTKSDTSVISFAWEALEPFFSAALVGANFTRSDGNNFRVIKVVRFTLFAALSAIFFSLFMHGENADAGATVGFALFSVLGGWGSMFGLLQLSSTHRNYILQERIDTYLPKFEQIALSNSSWKDTSNAIWFPAPWFGYYGIIWPLVAVTAVFFTIDFVILVNVKEDVYTNGSLVSAWEFLKMPWLFMGVWAALGASFNSLLFNSINDRVSPFVHANNLDKEAVHKLCRPKLWRAVLATVVFIGVIITPGTYIFPDEEQQINAAVSGRNKSPQQLYDQAFAALSGKNSSLSATAAATYLRKAADSGHVLSQAQLGYLYREGRGVGKDFSKAIFWLDKAAQSGNLNAALDLGYYLVRGENGFPKDEVKAVQLWRLAADRGNATAQTNLGISYAIGTGSLPTDFHQAIYWYGLAAKQGDAEAAFQLAKLYDNGRGVPRDAGTAMAWYKESVRLGKNDGAERLAVLEQEQGAERSEMTNRVNVVVSELESRFPEFNPNSPRFNKQMVNAVLAGQASYIKQNYAPDVALRMAGSDVYRQANLHNRR